MNSLKVKQLTLIRNSIVFGTMIVGFIAWFALPWIVENTKAVHVGNGRFGSKIGVLIVLLFPLLALIPNTNREEIHTEDPVERVNLLEEQLAKERKIQIAVAVLELIVIVFVYVLWFTHAA